MKHDIAVTMRKVFRILTYDIGMPTIYIYMSRWDQPSFIEESSKKVVLFIHVKT